MQKSKDKGSFTANGNCFKFRFIELLQVCTKRLPLGEAVAEIGASEPISVTDEGQPLRCFLRFFASKVLVLPSSAPVCELGHLPPGEGILRSRKFESAR